MRRRRMKRSKKKNDRYGAATVVLLLLLVAAFIYAFQALGIYDILFKPTFNNSPGLSPVDTTPPITGSFSPGPSVTGASASAGVKISEEIKLNNVTLYGVQLGVYTKLENAQATADKFKKDGSAGYLLKEDILYRVVDSIFYSEADAKALRDIFRKGTSPDACILPVQASGINWKITATREQIDAIRSSMSTLQGQIIVLINTQKSAQQKQGTADDWKNAISGASQKIKDTNDAMMKAVGNTKTTMILKLNDCLKQSADSLDKLSKTDSADTVALISGLKYNIIDILLKLQNNIMG